MSERTRIIFMPLAIEYGPRRKGAGPAAGGGGGGGGGRHAHEADRGGPRERPVEPDELRGDEHDQAEDREARPEPDHEFSPANLVLPETEGAHDHERAPDGADSDEHEVRERQELPRPEARLDDLEGLVP